MKTRTTRFGVFLLLIMLVLPFAAQDNLAAVMLVQSDGVMVQRVGTNQFLPVTTEAIVGVGDTIRTDETGRALITFFADGVDTTLEPGTEYRIDVFQGESDTFQLTVSVLVGQTSQRLERVLDPASNYDVNTPGVDLAARGTAFDVRVEQGGRSAMIVTEGVVAATKEEQDAEVPVGFGIRAAVGGALSNVVVATTFAELDAAIDGCTAALTTPDDGRIAGLPGGRDCVGCGYNESQGRHSGRRLVPYRFPGWLRLDSVVVGGNSGGVCRATSVRERCRARGRLAVRVHRRSNYVGRPDEQRA